MFNIKIKRKALKSLSKIVQEQKRYVKEIIYCF